jgi:ferrous iron transport protein B
VITQDVNFLNLERKEIQGSFTKSHSDLKRLQQKTIKRYQFINDVLKEGLSIDASMQKIFVVSLIVFSHKLWGM